MSEESDRLDAISRLIQSHQHLVPIRERTNNREPLTDDDLRVMLDHVLEAISGLGLVLTTLITGPVPPEFLFWLEERKKSE